MTPPPPLQPFPGFVTFSDRDFRGDLYKKGLSIVLRLGEGWEGFIFILIKFLHYLFRI